MTPMKNKRDAKTVKAAKSAAKKTIAKKNNSKNSEEKLSLREKKVLGIKDRLLKQKEELLSEAESALGELPGQILFPDMGDQASAEIDRNFMLRLRGREQKLLKKIDNVLEMIEKGAYGICEVCGNEIEIKRLEARPVTSMCIDCKTEQEDEEKLRE
jgi:DnaK suppressor protein